jgi:hypothetical protein
METTFWTSDAFIDGAVKLPVRETTAELAWSAAGESGRRVRDIEQRDYDSSDNQPRSFHNDHLVSGVKPRERTFSRHVRLRFFNLAVSRFRSSSK